MVVVRGGGSDCTSPIQPLSTTSSSSDWDRPFTVQELQDIDAIFQSATSSSSSSSRIKIRRRIDYGYNPPKSRRRLPDSIFQTQPSFPNSSSLLPCPAKLTMKYPEMTFGGHIMYSRTIDEVEKAAKELLNLVETKKKEVGWAVLGFDIEWKPTFRRGVPPGKAAVMQICGDTSKCHVMHIIHSGIPQNLRSLLEDPTLIKVGVCIANDAHKVLKDHNVSIEALEDLSDVANQKLSGDPKKWSLASLTETLICKQLPKPTKIRLGNWERPVLTKEQLQYAATDAFASWYLYEALKSLPDAVDDQNKEPQSAAQD